MRSPITLSSSFNANTFPLKKKLVEIVYNASRLELPNITFLETQAIIDNMPVNLQPSAITTVLNLNRACQYLLTTEDTGLTLLKNINYFVAENESLEWGVLRTGLVSVSGVEESILIPSVASVEAVLQNVDTYNLLLDLITTQPFWDGNKRTCYLYCLLYHFRNTAEIFSLDYPSFSSDLYAAYQHKYSRSVNL